MAREYSSVKDAFNSIKGLTQNRNRSEEEVWALANEKYIDGLFSVEKEFSLASEKAEARKLVHKYMNDYNVETISDRNTLSEIIYYEIIQKRLQKKLNKMHREDKAVNTNLVKMLHQNSDVILTLKDKLGLNKGSRKDQTDSKGELQHLKKRFELWRKKNQGSRHLVCPHCSQMVRLKIRTDAWEAQKHPFFIDRMLANPALVKLWEEKKITKEECAKVLDVSEDYIDWLVELWKKNKDDREQKN